MTGPGEDPHLAAILAEHPAVAAASVVAEGARVSVRVVPDPENAPVLHRLCLLRERGELAGLGDHEVGGLLVVGVNRSETVFLHEEVVAGDAYLRHGLVLPDAARVVDVGANIGMFTLLAAARSPGAHVVAVEASPLPARALAANVALHGVDADVVTCAVADRPGTAQFTTYPRNTLMSGLEADAEDRAVLRRYLLTGGDAETDEAGLDRLVADRMVAETTPMPVRTLDDVLAGEPGPVDLLKVDVEKAEQRVLDGIGPGLWPRIQQVAAEIHDIDGRLARMTADLTARGFDVVAEQDRRLADTPCHTLYARRPGYDRPPATPAPAPAWPTVGGLRADIERRLGRDVDLELVAALTAAPAPRAPAADGSAPSPVALAVDAAWAEIFGAHAVRDDADLFDLRGTSLTAVRLLDRIEQRLGPDTVDPDLVFTHTRLGALRAALDDALGTR